MKRLALLLAALILVIVPARAVGPSCDMATNLACAPTSSTAGRVCIFSNASGDLDNACTVTCSSGTLTGALSGNASTATALVSNPSDCTSSQFATTIAANGDLTCAQPAFSDLSGAATDAQVPNTITIDLAAAATALATNPTDCSTDQYATTIAASGNLTCSQVAFSQLSGSATDGQIPNGITIDLAAAATALAANGANCSAGSFPLGVDPSGAAESCTALSGSNAGTATALAANGSNCSAGNYPLGVDASGNAESCTAAGGISGSGTSGKVPRWTGSTALGDSTISDDATTATTGKRFAHTPITAATLSADTDNFNPGDTAIVRIAASPLSYLITGISGGTDGRLLWLWNVSTGGQEILIPDEADALASTSTAANRIITNGGTLTIGGVGLELNAGAPIMLIYDGTLSRWRVVSQIYGGGAPGMFPYFAAGGSQRVDVGPMQYSPAQNKIILTGDFEGSGHSLGTLNNPWAFGIIDVWASLTGDLKIETDDSRDAPVDRVTITGEVDQAEMTLLDTDLNLGGGELRNWGVSTDLSGRATLPGGTPNSVNVVVPLLDCANDQIMLTVQVPGAPLGHIYVQNCTDDSDFDIYTDNALETSDIGWFIVRR